MLGRNGNSLLGNLDERIAGHVLNTLVRLVREFEEFVNDSLEELPVRLEETRVLSNDVHDIGSAARSMKHGQQGLERA